MTTMPSSNLECIEIRAKAPFPAGALSNFAVHAFTLDGVKIKSMEGFLQSLKFADIVEQADICLLAGARAVQFLIFGDDIEQKVEIERGAPSGIFDVFASVRAEQIIGEGA